MQGNYRSYQEIQNEAEASLREDLRLGRLEWSKEKEHLEAKYGPIALNKIGAMVKWQNERKKVRLVHDLRESGVNHRVKTDERVVLPRLGGVAREQ